MCRSWILKDRVRRPVILHLLSNAKTLHSWNMPMHTLLCTMHLTSRSPNPACTMCKHPGQKRRPPVSARYCHRVKRTNITMHSQSTYCMHQAFNMKRKNDVYLTWVTVSTGCWQRDTATCQADSYPGWTALLLEIWTMLAQLGGPKTWYKTSFYHLQVHGGNR